MDFIDFDLLMSLSRRTSAYVDHYHILLYLHVRDCSDGCGSGVCKILSLAKETGFAVFDFSLSKIDIITTPRTSRLYSQEELEIYIMGGIGFSEVLDVKMCLFAYFL